MVNAQLRGLVIASAVTDFGHHYVNLLSRYFIPVKVRITASEL